MSLKSLMKYLEKRSAATPVTSQKSMGLQPEPAWIGGVPSVTPVTLQLNKAHENVQPTQFGEAVNDPASPQPPAIPAKPRKLTFIEWQQGWIEFDQAYQRHHFNCPVCIAAGLNYGLRCGTGAALYRAYSDTSSDKSALGW